MKTRPASALALSSRLLILAILMLLTALMLVACAFPGASAQKGGSSLLDALQSDDGYAFMNLAWHSDRDTCLAQAGMSETDAEAGTSSSTTLKAIRALTFEDFPLPLTPTYVFERGELIKVELWAHVESDANFIDACGRLDVLVDTRLPEPFLKPDTDVLASVPVGAFSNVYTWEEKDESRLTVAIQRSSEPERTTPLCLIVISVAAPIG